MGEIGPSPQQRSLIAASVPEHLLFWVLSLLPPDEIIGVRDITRALTGADDAAAIRALFHLLERTTTYPAYKKGSRWAVSRAAIRAQKWVQERRAFGNEDQQSFGLLYLLLKGAIALYADAACGRCSPEQLAQLALVSNEAAGLIKRLFRDQPDVLTPPSHRDQTAAQRVVTK